MTGNVSLYEVNAGAVAGMLEGNLLPQRAEMLSNIIAITFIGTRQLPTNWLSRTLQVRRSVVHEALHLRSTAASTGAGFMQRAQQPCIMHECVFTSNGLSEVSETQILFLLGFLNSTIVRRRCPVNRFLLNYIEGVKIIAEDTLCICKTSDNGRIRCDPPILVLRQLFQQKGSEWLFKLHAQLLSR